MYVYLIICNHGNINGRLTHCLPQLKEERTALHNDCGFLWTRQADYGPGGDEIHERERERERGERGGEGGREGGRLFTLSGCLL